MKPISFKLSSVILSALLAFSSTSSLISVADDETTAKPNVTIHFDLSEPGITIAPDEDGNPQTIEDIEIQPYNAVRLPEAIPAKEGFIFNGWTADGIEGYTADSVFLVTTDNVTLTPVWSDPEDVNYYNVSYKVEYADGTVLDTSKQLRTQSYRSGEFVNVSAMAFQHNDYSRSQMGWLCEGREYRGEQKIIVTDHDLLLTPSWHRFFNLTFSPGDVDRLVGATSQTFERLEGTATETAASDRFSRNGFKIIGWICDDGDVFYNSLQMYTMPSKDVTFTAVWEPIEYTVVFNPGNKNQDDFIKIKGKTDTSIVVPDINITKPGYYFDGWEYENVVYKPGEEFFIKGAMSGRGISLKAVWKLGTAPTTQPPTDPDAIYGDATGNGEVKMNDAVLIMQVCANSDLYSIDEKYLVNADCYIPGSGITNMDAIAIQKLLINVVPSLPILEEK